MVVGIHRRSVGVFSNRRDAEQALHELKHSGFPMDRVSVIAQNGDRDDDLAGTPVQEKVGNKADEGATTGAISGGVLGGLGGLLVGLGTLAIPGIGPIMLAGATATALATTLAGAGIGAVAGGLLGALIGLGIPEERAKVYEERVRRGHYLVIIDGTDAEIAQAEAILHRRGIEEYGVYNSPNGQRPTTDVTRRDTAPSKYAIGYFPLLQDAETAINDLRNAGFPLNQISLIHREPLQQQSFTGINVSNRFDSTRWQLPSDRFQRGDYLVIVDGTEAQIHQAETILKNRGIEEFAVFNATDLDTEHHHRQGLERSRHEDIVRTEKPVTGDRHDPAVVIVDNREERI